MKEKIAFGKGYRIKNGLCFNPSHIEIKGYFNCDGYKVFNLRIDNKVKKITFHRLLAYEKYGDKIFEKGIEIRHLNSNKLDNNWNNILIGTHSDNMQDMCPIKRKEKALHATSYIRKYDKQKVQNFHKTSGSYKNTMNQFGITSKATLNYILKN